MQAERLGPRLERGVELAQAPSQHLGDEHLVQPARPARHAGPSYGTAGRLRPHAGDVRTGVQCAQMARAYTLKIELTRIRPAIWRRVVVPGNLSLARLHLVIHDAMG
jgi:hypothetical protein